MMPTFDIIFPDLYFEGSQFLSIDEMRPQQVTSNNSLKESQNSVGQNQPQTNLGQGQGQVSLGFILSKSTYVKYNIFELCVSKTLLSS